MSTDPNSKKAETNKNEGNSEVFVPLIIQHPEIQEILVGNRRLARITLFVVIINMVLCILLFSISYGNKSQIFLQAKKTQAVNEDVVEYVCTITAEQAVDRAVNKVKEVQTEQSQKIIQQLQSINREVKNK